ncbi:MAG: nuclear transport factor 2 family protein [Sphingopyxis sp.]|uniref:nuclear transport factor 2 family protein n=1 Tax=Sphingopyxis sp. TaxID=1908224 RepID=UPI0032EC69F1
MTPLEASRAMYAEVAKGNWRAVAGYMADDFVIHEPSSLPYGGEWRGRDALQKLYAHVMGYWEEPVVRWVELVGGEKHAVALLHFTVTAKSSGKRFETHVAEVTSFDDAGKMASMRIHYFDTADMLGQLNA